MNINGKEVADTYCSLTHMELQIRPGGLVNPCNRYLFRHTGSRPADFSIHHHSVDFLLKEHPVMQGIRGRLDKGIRDPDCAKCFEEEDAGKAASIRQIYNRSDQIMKGIDPSVVELRWIEFATSNLCNLKCRMCFPELSAKLKDDWVALYGTADPLWNLQRTPPLNLDNILVPTLRHIKFTGGEPLLINEYKDILREVVKRLDPKKIYLNYSTNLMVEPDDELIALWQQFDYVEFAVSLDGTGKFIEYQRNPSKWDTIERVTKRFLQLHKDFDARVGLRSTITIYNVLNVVDLTQWWIDAVNEYYSAPFGERSWFNPTHAHIPDHLSITVLPQDKKQMVMDLLWEKPHQFAIVTKNWNHFCRYMNSEDKTHLLPEFRRFTRILDERRGEDFRLLCPEFADLMDES
ncbi:MAG: radical SAM protein [Bdellovibrionales bacterium]|nr:radical SAM protein [Bdellovibrionales bacterium]